MAENQSFQAGSSQKGSSGVAASSATTQSASAAISAPTSKIVPVIGRKGFARHYLSKASLPCRFVDKVEGGAWLCHFFAYPDDAAQHTSISDITGCSSKEGSDQALKPVSEPSETPVKQGQKVWALKNGGGYECGRVIHVFGAHQTALVMFFASTGHPSQNTKWKDISLTKPA